MHHMQVKLTGVLLLAASWSLTAGCVERTLKIDSVPQGARVFVNDEEIGVTPAKTSFLWYGDYDIVLRLEGYQTLRTSYFARAPWYQYPPFDLIAECFVAATIRDEHVLPAYELTPAEPPVLREVVDRAVRLREETFGQPSKSE